MVKKNNIIREKIEKKISELEKPEEQKEIEQMWGCMQNHSEERDIYNRANTEKLKIAKNFKERGNLAFKEKKFPEASYMYQKVPYSF